VPPQAVDRTKSIATQGRSSRAGESIDMGL
jgi:hypothetical protein